MAPPRARPRELVREPRLAHAGLAGDQHDPAVAVHLRRRPTPRAGARARRARPTNSVACARVERRAAARPAPRPAAPQPVEQRAGLARRRDRQRRTQPLGEALARDERRGAVTCAREALDQPPVGAPRRAGRAPPARASGGPPRPGRRVAAASRSSVSASRSACAWRASCAQSSSKPSRIGAGRPPARAADRRDGAPRRTGACRRRRAVERDRVAGGYEFVGGGAERAAQLAQRGAQAGAGRLVEDVGPEAGGELGARVRAGVQREVGEHAAGPARRRRRRARHRRRRARSPPPEPDPQHAPTFARLLHRATFTQAERCANGRPGPSPPCRSPAAATSACSPAPPAFPRSATSWR